MIVYTMNSGIKKTTSLSELEIAEEAIGNIIRDRIAAKKNPTQGSIITRPQALELARRASSETEKTQRILQDIENKSVAEEQQEENFIANIVATSKQIGEMNERLAKLEKQSKESKESKETKETIQILTKKVEDLSNKLSESNKKIESLTTSKKEVIIALVSTILSSIASIIAFALTTTGAALVIGVVGSVLATPILIFIFKMRKKIWALLSGIIASLRYLPTGAGFVPNVANIANRR